ncbi:MAG TPA: NAD(P)/FAD-dependent oxidoreductase [Thermoanaerobaculia bacterium]|nr:NAD(P)/FAD-dependent oxidoreductase [Thermoanaerobaculia bacterium]
MADAARPAAEIDVAIVGGGPAGLATAIGARLAGLSAVVLDPRLPPIEKACGEGLMPDAVARLAALGVRIPPGESHPLKGIRYLDGDLALEGVFPEGRHGLGIRRLALHRALIDRAAALGADLRFGVTARGLNPRGVETDLGPVAARWVVGADGLLSAVRRWAGLDLPAATPDALRRFGVRRHYRIAPWTSAVEVHWGPACEAYVTPISAGEVGVALLWSGSAKGFDDLLARLPALAARLAGAPPTSRDRGAGPLLQPVRGVVRGSVALVGDAAGYLDAITGEGLAVAFHQAAALVEALKAGDLRRYAAAHRRIGRLPTIMTRVVLACERRPALRRRVLAALAAEPALFSRLLGIHGRILPARELGLDGAFRLARRLVLRPS